MMKKIAIALAMLFTMTTATMAENNNVETTTSVEAFNFKININSLTRALNLSKDQQEMYVDIMKSFERNMDLAAKMPTEERKMRLARNTVRTNLRDMKCVLDTDQFRTYLMILNTTLYNRGIFLTTEDVIA